MYKILDLFAGAGGLSLGFEMTDKFKVGAIVENNKNAAKTYINNHPGLKNYEDIMKVDFKKLQQETGNIDVIIGGPPCQGFSNANRQRRQLINGSNELVKKYVQAVRDIRPKVFVMENVKTIASDKHSFCLTNTDREYIEKQLELTPHSKDVILYEGSNVNLINELCNNHSIEELNLLDEEQLYVLYNVYKKRNQLEKYFEKSVNIKKIQSIAECLKNKEELPQWYNEYTQEAKTVLQEMIERKQSVSDESMEKLKAFWDVQRFFQGIMELNTKDAIYEIIPENTSITVRMHTYIVIDYILRAFKDLGYQVKGEVLNAASFGVPQNRERFILIGVRDNLAENQDIKLPEALIKDPQKYVTVNEAIDDLKEYEPTTSGMGE
ncbi:MAG: DNA cytosine methyltransferase, partial [Lachnospiraceae bacterium]|nr:DNA cytosine methyltransferase [Lachnospiraceae bacterium]